MVQRRGQKRGRFPKGWVFQRIMPLKALGNANEACVGDGQHSKTIIFGHADAISEFIRARPNSCYRVRAEMYGPRAVCGYLRGIARALGRRTRAFLRGRDTHGG